MIVTLTEMGDRVYGVRIQRGRQERVMRLSRELRDAIKKRGRLVWKTTDFGLGRIGEQAQYRIDKRACGS